MAKVKQSLFIGFIIIFPHIEILKLDNFTESHTEDVANTPVTTPPHRENNNNSSNGNGNFSYVQLC